MLTLKSTVQQGVVSDAKHCPYAVLSHGHWFPALAHKVLYKISVVSKSMQGVPRNEVLRYQLQPSWFKGICTSVDMSNHADSMLPDPRKDSLRTAQSAAHPIVHNSQRCQ